MKLSTQFSVNPNRIISLLLIIVTSFFSVCTAKAQCGTTSYVGGTSAGISPGAATQLNIAVDGNGTPYVAYKDNTSTPTINEITVIKYNGTSWVQVGSVLGAGTAPAMGVAPDNTPYAAFVNSSSKLTVMKFTSGTWSTVGAAALSAGSATYVNLRFGPSGTPYVSFTDAGSNIRTTVLKYNSGTSSWVTLGSAGFSFSNSMNTNYTSLAIDRNDTPYVAFSDVGTTPTGLVEVMKFNGTSWVRVGSTAASADRGNWVSLALDPTGHPYVAYEEIASPNWGDVAKFNGTSWVTIGSQISLESVVYNALAIDSFSNVYYMYSSAPANSRKSDLLMYNGSTWTTLATNFTGTSNLPTMALSPTGTPYMCYYDGASTPVNRLMVQTISYSTGITPGSNPSVAQGATVAHLGYTGAAGLPNKYSISWSAAAKAAGFADVTNASLTSTPIDITVPAAAPLATYPASLSVSNSSGCISGTYSINVQVTTALPVTLQSFTGTKNKDNILNWSIAITGAPVNIELQRSPNGNSFSTIAKLSMNNSGNYNYTDKDYGNDNYYRLAIINEDGSIQYSKTVSIKNDAISNISIYPNPVTTSIRVTGLSAGMYVSISDMAGRIITTKAINTTTDTHSIPLSDYAPGVYQLSVLKGKELVRVLKLIKK